MPMIMTINSPRISRLEAVSRDDLRGSDRAVARRVARALTAPPSTPSPLGTELSKLPLTAELAALFALNGQLEIASGELVDLVKEQQRSNEQLKAVREVEGFIRTMTGKGHVTREDMEQLKALTDKVNREQGLGINFDDELGTLAEDLHRPDGQSLVGDGEKSARDYLIPNELAEGNQKKNGEQIKNMKAELADLKDVIKGNVSQNELRLQLANQEYNNARQALSTLSHRYDEVNRGIIANFA